MSDLTLVIGNKNYSSWSLRPWIFLTHNQIPFTEKKIALYTDQTARQLAPYFSDGKVPVLKDGELLVWDSLAILEYVAERFPHCHGWPADPDARATARSVSAEMHSSFADLRNELPMNCRKRFENFVLSKGVLRDVERIMAVWRHCMETYGQDGPWLFGRFGIADAMFAPVAIRFHGYGVPLEGRAAKYVQTLLENPSMQRWIARGKQEKEIIENAEIDESERAPFP